jgi:hypothetical protein
MTVYGSTTPVSAVSLARYAEIIGYSDCAFWGVNSPSNINYGCREIWTQPQRDDVLLYLSEAQEELEQILQYPLMRRWFENERHNFNQILIARWGKIISPGTKVISIIRDDAAVSHATDPAMITITPTAQLSDWSEIKVYYPDTDIEITPSDISYNSGTLTLTITIPRCRLVDYPLRFNPDTGLDYSVISNFETLVDVHRVYNDATIQAKLVHKDSICSSFCVEDYDSSCMWLDNPILGIIHVDLNVGCFCGNYSHADLNYEAGVYPLSRIEEQMIVRLAHAKMPVEPCGCDVTQRIWRRDREEPKIMTRDRANCPFGTSNGAWTAWKWACNNELVRITPLTGRYRGYA